MAWTDLRDAMHAAIVKASGLATGKVIWKFQNAAQPAMDYIAMTVSPASNPGQDGLVSSTDLMRPAGQEIKLAVRGFREVTLELEVFTATIADSSDAMALAEKIRSALRLPSVRDVLAAVGASPFDIGPTQYLPEIVAVGFRGRATLPIRCFVPAQDAADFTGYIASVHGTLTAKGGVGGDITRSF